MSKAEAIETELRLALQIALLDEVSPNLRCVTGDWEGSEVKLRFLFDGEISEKDRESAACVGTEVVASFPAPWTIQEEVERLDFPEDRRARSLPIWAYARREETR